MKTKYHVLPVNDIKPHNESMFCECAPKTIKDKNGFVIVHNSFDGREYDEEDNKKFGKKN